MQQAQIGNRIGKKKELKTLTFFLALSVATAFFVPFIITGKGYFIFFGDFNVQQIPFYQYCHEAVRSGEIFWSWQTDLGANFIGSYSFYLLGSPFFWLTLPFPNSFVPYLMGPLLILKFACAALAAYMFIRRFTARAESALIGGLLYAFSGFSVYNIFFNHFHEAIIFFPLLLLALELFISEKRRGLLIAAVFICCLSNYFFFFGMVVFVIIYWFVRTLSGSFKFKFSEFLLLLLECVLGVLLTAVVILPTVIEVAQNSRLESLMNGWGAIMYGKEQIFLNVIECFFFPPDLPARPVFFPGADVKWSSLGGWLPLFGMTGTITFLLSQKRGHWLRRIIAISAFMALVPFLNSAFTMFNSAYYARWFYMPILMMCLATAIALEDTEVKWDTAWRWSFGITFAFAAVIAVFPTRDNYKLSFGLYTKATVLTSVYEYITGKTDHIETNIYDLRFFVAVATALLSLFVIKAFIPAIKRKTSSIFAPLTAFVCVVSVLYSAFFVGSGQSHSYEIEDVMIDELIEGKVTLENAEDEFSRIDVYDGVDNTGLFLGCSSINFFHSVVPAGIPEYYEYVGVERSVGSRPSEDFPAIRNLLSVKYLLDPDIDNSDEFANSNGKTAMPNYSYYDTQNGYTIYKNNNYIPMGFTYDYYVTSDRLKDVDKHNLSRVMLKALLIENSDAAELSPYLENITDSYYFKEYEADKRQVSFTNTEMANDCYLRNQNAGYSFKYDSKGFASKIKLDKANAVFYSVPYSEGWTAYVNGQKAEIFKVNKGFMAVVAPEGDNEIVFKYETPGLSLGIKVSVVAAIITVTYLLIVLIVRRTKGKTPPEYPEGERIANHIMLYYAANEEADNPTDNGLLDQLEQNSMNAYSGFSGGFTINDSALDDLDGLDGILNDDEKISLSEFGKSLESPQDDNLNE